MYVCMYAKNLVFYLYLIGIVAKNRIYTYVHMLTTMYDILANCIRDPYSRIQDVMILKIFYPKNLAIKLAFLTR
jgi:hypothetical protein